ncbi:MAG: 2-oxoglutarate dehydrogenase E1 component [Desulfuromonadaceae bacterium]|nr:2-oxoglutarate dehydrogenase E1 component [Desulfuromonadaceae bacterium]
MNFWMHLSPEYLEKEYRRWQADPDSVAADRQLFFSGFDLALETKTPLAAEPALKESAVQSLLYRYRDLGHLQAAINPLDPAPATHPRLALESFGLDENDLDRVFHSVRFEKESATLREILAILGDTYCRSVGVEFMHIQNPVERDWLKERMEPCRNRPQLSRETKLAVLGKIQEAALFERFLQRKFVGQKRFSLEGGETLIPLLDALVEHAARSGVRDLVMGMSHRGRLNVLANILRKPLENIFAEFADNLELGFIGDGDVKYHKGFSTDRKLPSGATIHLTVAPNPSHLEAVDPVVIGKSRARHNLHGPGGKQKVLPVLIHGDAAFAGQGLVAETLNLSQIDGYQVGGTLHVIVNNQIGFTATAKDARSTPYATDVAKMLQAPIFHIHGEDPEAAVFVAELAFDYRQRFAKDAVVEICCYRRHGHNEGDEPSFTQPLMYARIKDRPPIDKVYAEQLVAEGVPPAAIDALAQEVTARLETALEAAPQPAEVGYQEKWARVQRDYSPQQPVTAVAAKTLQQLGKKLAHVPSGFALHPKVEKLLHGRLAALESGAAIDWGNAEALAFASLLAEGVPVRVSGQDSRRGTFNHRHAMLVDQRNGALFTPYAALGRGQAAAQFYNSMLSEAAVLGFEYGYSLETPEGLTIWEAQFGDFANGAQVIIDQFIAGGISKWDRASGITLFLPHGYEGQGAEHSSARIERYLQLCAEENLLVTYPSSPAQFFHLLRRQVKLPYRRPLVVFTPKSLLRNPLCRSSVRELSSGTFQPVLPATSDPQATRRVLVCCGKIYYELLARLNEEQRDDVALIRVEQLYPLHTELLSAALEPYRALDRPLFWVQEEPENMGAWRHLRPQLAALAAGEVGYFGREAAAVPAVGLHRLHLEEQQHIIDAALTL